jgi:hypothetical protein
MHLVMSLLYWMATVVLILTAGTQIISGLEPESDDTISPVKNLYLELLLFNAIGMWYQLFCSILWHASILVIVIQTVSAIYWTWAYNHDKDDRWKKRRKKLKDKVLTKVSVLVPVLAPSH